jgi:predicted nucleotidyltransferase
MPAAVMTVTIDAMVARWRHARSERRSRADARALLARLPDARRLLVDRYGARRVWLFGSLARGDTRESSDVDVAVEGLDPMAYFPALADLTGLFDASVDLVEVERASPSLLARLDLEGMEL